MAVNILHLGIVKEQFYLWGEKSPNGGSETLRKQRRKSRLSLPKLPFGAAIADLIDGLNAANVNHHLKNNEILDMAVWLPTRSDMPLASSILIAEVPPGRSKFAFVPWSVTGIRLSVLDTIDLLCAAIDKPTLSPGLIAGTDVAYWSIAIRFATGLVVRQQYLPGMREVGDGYIAEWEPVIDGQDEEYVLELARQMPGVARTMTSIKASEVPAESAEKMLHRFIACIVDALIRSAVQCGERQPFLPNKSSKKRRAVDSVHDAWLAALQTGDATIAGDLYELKDLAGQIAHWQRPVRMASTAPVRLCFRLEEPELAVADRGSIAPPGRQKTNGPIPGRSVICCKRQRPEFACPG